MALSRSSADFRRPLDIHPTVLRLRRDVVDYVRKRKAAPTIEILDLALQDLSVLPPWERAKPGRLGQDFVNALEHLDPTTRQTVRLTLGFDHPEESLTDRRARLRSTKAGGSAHIQVEQYALAQALYALLASKMSQIQQPIAGLGGFVIREVAIVISLEDDRESHQVTLLADCQRDGERIFLVPTIETLEMPGSFVARISRDGATEYDIGVAKGSFWIDPTAVAYGHYHIVALEYPCKKDDRVQITLLTSHKEARALRSFPTEGLWWRSLGTERLVTLRLNAPTSLIKKIWGVVRTPDTTIPKDVDSSLNYRLDEDDDDDDHDGDEIHTWSVLSEPLETDHVLELRWRFDDLLDNVSEVKA